MHKKHYKISSFIIILSVMLYSCKMIEYFQQDSFYRNGSEMDHLRFPLIKPYYAIYITDEFGWGIHLPSGVPNSNIYYYAQINAIQKISVENEMIMVFTPYEQDVEESIGEKVYYWFVLMPAQGIEVGFDKEKDFSTYILQFGVKEPNWRTPDDILKEYDDTWCLDWILTCN